MGSSSPIFGVNIKNVWVATTHVSPIKIGDLLNPLPVMLSLLWSVRFSPADPLVFQPSRLDQSAHPRHSPKGRARSDPGDKTTGKIHENARGVKTRHKFFGKRMVKIACRMVCTLENTHTLLGTYIFPTSRHFWVDDFPFPQVGYVIFVEGTTCFSQNPPIHLCLIFFLRGGFTFAGFSLWVWSRNILESIVCG